MAVAYVKKTVGGAVSGSTFNLPVTYTAGNALAIWMAGQNGQSSLTIADGGSNTFTEVDHLNPGTAQIWAFYAKNLVGSGSTLAFTASGSTEWAVVVLEFSGVDTTTALGGFANGTNTSNSPGVDIVSASLSAAGASGDAVVCGVSNYYTATMVVGSTNPSGMAVPTGAFHNNGDSLANAAACYAILSGSYSAAVSMNPGASNTYGHVVGFVLKAAAGGGGGGANHNSLSLLGVG